MEVGGASKIDGYKIYANGDLVTTVSPQTLSHTLDTVTQGNSYIVAISAFSIIGEGAKSLDSLFWAIDTPTAPILSVLKTSRDSCTMSWTAVPPPAFSLITGYILMIDDGLGGDFTVAYDGSVNPSLQVFTVENLRQ